MRTALPCILLLAAGCDPVLDASVKTNPVCDISAVVTWTTDDPASSWVEVSQDGAGLFRVGDEALSTEHEVIVVGMHAEGAYQLEAVSTDEGGKERRSDPLDFEAGPLPEIYLQGTLHSSIPDSLEPGWVLTNVMTGSRGPAIVELLDEDGIVVWYYIRDGDSAGADIQASWIPESREVLVGPNVEPGDHAFQIDLMGRESWAGPEQPGDPDLVNITDGQLHHVLHMLDNGDRVAVESQYETIEDEQVQGDRVVQLDQDNVEVWSWSAFDHIPYAFEDVYLGLWWTHMNSVEVDLDEDVVWINSWVHGQVWKVDRATGDIIWTLGEGGDFAPDPEHPEPWFAYSHAFEPMGDGHFLIHDNGSSQRGYTRILEYVLDEDAMTAEIVWEYPGQLADDWWYVASAGDVDLQPNGNRLVVAYRRILEITEAGELAWEYEWSHADLVNDLRSYQVEKIPSLVEAM